MANIASVPFNVYRFIVEIKGVDEGLCTEVSGLVSDIETEVFKEGGLNEYAHILPTRVNYPNLILKRGMVDLNLFDWYMKYRDTLKIERKNVSIKMVGGYGKVDISKVLHVWDIRDAFPVKWTGPQLNASSSAIAFESIEFAHQGIHKER